MAHLQVCAAHACSVREAVAVTLHALVERLQEAMVVLVVPPSVPGRLAERLALLLAQSMVLSAGPSTNWMRKGPGERLTCFGSAPVANHLTNRLRGWRGFFSWDYQSSPWHTGYGQVRAGLWSLVASGNWFGATCKLEDNKLPKVA